MKLKLGPFCSSCEGLSHGIIFVKFCRGLISADLMGGAGGITPSNLLKITLAKNVAIGKGIPRGAFLLNCQLCGTFQ